MKNMIIYWLEQIHAKISELGDSVNAAGQSDWSEVDSTASSYIQNKPHIPAGAIIVAGTVATNAFTPTKATFATTLEHITEGSGLVYLSYESNSATVYDLVVTASADSMVSAGGKTWSAPAES